MTDLPIFAQPATPKPMAPMGGAPKPAPTHPAASPGMDWNKATQAPYSPEVKGLMDNPGNAQSWVTDKQLADMQPKAAPPAPAPAAQNPLMTGVNTQQINTGESDILSQIGDALSQLFGGSMGGQTPAGYEWDGFQGWVPKAGAQPAAPAAPAAAPAPAAPVTREQIVQQPPSQLGGPQPQNAAAMEAAAQKIDPNLVWDMTGIHQKGAMKPRTVIPSQETGAPKAPIGPNPNMFQK